MKAKKIIGCIIVLLFLFLQITTVTAATDKRDSNKSLMKDKNIVKLVNYICISINNSDDSFSNVKKTNGEQMHRCVYEFLYSNYKDLDKYGYCGKDKSSNYGTYEWVYDIYDATHDINVSGYPLKAKNVEDIAASFFGKSYNKKIFRNIEGGGLQYYKGKYYFAMADGASKPYAKIKKITSSGKGIYKISATQFYDSEYDEEGPIKKCDFYITIKSDKKSLFSYHITSCKVE